MPKPPPHGTKTDPSQPAPDETLNTGFYEVPAGDEPSPDGRAPVHPAAGGTGNAEGGAQGAEEPQGVIDLPDLPFEDSTPSKEPPTQPKRNTRLLKILVVALALALVLGGVLMVRRQRQRRALREGLNTAAELMRPDTYAGYRDAADLLKSLVPLDPLQAGSARAFALGMLVSDYREEAKAQEAEALLAEPERSAVVPSAADLAEAALLLSRQAGTATTFAARASGSPWSGTLQARVALAAGNLPAAADLLDEALAIDPAFPAALALKGDVLRRRKDFAGARDAYLAALRASPVHPRAAFGMAKLALSEKVTREQAVHPLEQMLSDPSTPSNERARAGLHLAALRARTGDRSGAAAAIEAARVPPNARPWLEKAVGEEELSRTGYHVVGGAPSALQSPHDDDPYESPPLQPPTVEKSKQAIKPAPAKHPKGKAKAGKKLKSKKSAKAKKKTPVKKKVAKRPVTDQ